MIISDKYRYIFIGLPFSASTAISKHLSEKYEGKPLLRKHSLYFEAKSQLSTKQKDYFVFSVIRNPMEIVATSYEKLKQNPNNMFENKKLFKENGGHINKRQRKKYNYIKQNQASFQDFFLKFYNTPYDNLASLAVDDCNYVIRYENIIEDYKNLLTLLKVKNIEPLPVQNKSSSKKKNLKDYYTKDIINRSVMVFGPFFKKHKYEFPNYFNDPKVSIFSLVWFNIISQLKKLKYTFTNKSLQKSSSETIYGKIQRKKN